MALIYQLSLNICVFTFQKFGAEQWHPKQPILAYIWSQHYRLNLNNMPLNIKTWTFLRPEQPEYALNNNQVKQYKKSLDINLTRCGHS